MMLGVGDTREKRHLSTLWSVLTQQILAVGGLDFLDETIDNFITIQGVAKLDVDFVSNMNESMGKLRDQMAREMKARDDLA